MSPSSSTAPTLSTAKELLARLVAFDTTSSKTNIPLIAFVETYLAEHGIESRRVPTPDGQKASLFATIGPGDGGGIALSGHTDMVPDLRARGLKVPFHLAFSYDEEVGCTGVRPMIGEFGKTLPTPRMVFVGEPSNMTVVDAHKGPVRWRVELTGRAAHSSMPHYGVNAIAYAGRLIGEILAMEEELKA